MKNDRWQTLVLFQSLMGLRRIFEGEPCFPLTFGARASLAVIGSWQVEPQPRRIRRYLVLL